MIKNTAPRGKRERLNLDPFLLVAKTKYHNGMAPVVPENHGDHKSDNATLLTKDYCAILLHFATRGNQMKTTTLGV